MFDAATIFAIVGTFLIAGTVKGVIGLGLPTVSLALLTIIIDLPSAMALLLVPSFVTNLWQAVFGGHGKAILLRLWPFLVMATATVWIGAMALTRVDHSLLSALLGLLLIVYTAVNLVGSRLTIPIRHEVWAGPVAGVANGILAGMTGSFVVPGVLFLQAIGLSKNVLIQSMGMLFMASTVALAMALQRSNLLTPEHGILSLAALLPATIGMVLGQRIRNTLSEDLFRQIFFISLLALGLYIVVKSL